MNIYYDVEDNHYRTYPDGDIATIDQMRELIENKNLSIAKLQQENEQLKTNWNMLKEFLKSTRKENLEWDKKHNCEWQGYNAYYELLIKMQELEQGSDNDVCKEETNNKETDIQVIFTTEPNESR